MTPFCIGLTGSIGMGKSTTAAMFAAHDDVQVWDADAAVHRLYAKGGAAVAPLAALQGAAIVDGAVDRGALKTWIAGDSTALKQIERVVHPLVAADRAAFIAACGAPICVLDIPLLFETGGDAAMDLVVVVSTDAATQQARVLARPGMTQAQFDRIKAAQLPDADKRARADFVIDTSSMDSAQAGVNAVLQQVRASNA